MLQSPSLRPRLSSSGSRRQQNSSQPVQAAPVWLPVPAPENSLGLFQIPVDSLLPETCGSPEVAKQTVHYFGGLMKQARK